MKILISPVNYENAINLIKQHVNGLLIGFKNQCLRSNYEADILEIAQIIKQKQKTCIFIKLNKLFFEHELDQLKDTLIALSKIGIDGIFFADFAIVQLIRDLHLSFNLIYAPETLNVSYGQFDFYLNQKFNGVQLANEIHMPELIEITKNKKQLQLFIQCSGYSFVMHSR